MKKLYSNIILVIFVVLAFAGTANAQSGKNIDQLTMLIDTSINEISQNISDRDASLILNYSSPVDYTIFKNRLIVTLKENQFNIVTSVDDATTVLNYSLNEVGIKYNEIFRDGLFGDYSVEREAGIKGSFSIEADNQILAADNFEITEIDTVDYVNIQNLSNYSLPFTQGKVPAEPFFASIWEPIIAVGTAIVTIFLFFTIRSK